LNRPAAVELPDGGVLLLGGFTGETYLADVGGGSKQIIKQSKKNLADVGRGTKHKTNNTIKAAC
jgi:hypothetical protein